MKIRYGYVSNSSSSSFVLRNINMFTEEELATIRERANREHWSMSFNEDENTIEFSTHQDTTLREFIYSIINKRFPSIDNFQY